MSVANATTLKVQNLSDDEIERGKPMPDKNHSIVS
jgi:hypothetical protein